MKVELICLKHNSKEKIQITNIILKYIVDLLLFYSGKEDRGTLKRCLFFETLPGKF